MDAHDYSEKKKWAHRDDSGVKWGCKLILLKLKNNLYFKNMNIMP